MSVPVRFTAAANYNYTAANVETLYQEEQYQQQYYQQNQPQHHHHHHLLYNNNNLINSGNIDRAEVIRQQQFMQQRSSMSSSVDPTVNNMSSTSTISTPTSIDESTVEQVGGGGNVTANTTDNAHMVGTEAWMSDEGRYGIPGAAGLEYQKFAEQQQQHDDDDSNDQNMDTNSMENHNNNNTTTNGNASSTNASLRNLEEKLISMSSEELFNTLKEYDALQDKYHTVLLLPKESKREVTAGGRDGSAYILRCLKMWYELPSDVLFSAMSLVDRFLDRMTVKPKHMACLSVASFHLAIKQLGLKPIPAEDLVTISQCGCTAGDLERMANVIAHKLGVQMGHGPITSVSFLRIYYALFRNCAKEIGGAFFEFYKNFIKLEELENRLENLLCDVKTTVITPSVLGLVLISLHLDFHIKASYTRGTPELKIVFNYILFLQKFMRIPDRVFTCGFSIVSDILSHYNGQNKQPYKQRLVWKLSTRTLRVLRPTKRFSSDLPTIEEGISNAVDDGLRSRTESFSSEEEEDWPTSPIIPIFEQC